MSDAKKANENIVSQANIRVGVLPSIPTAVSIAPQVVTSRGAKAIKPDDHNITTGEMNIIDNDEAWINHARSIIGKTSNDPYVQHREIGRLRTGYLKEQYNKDLKVVKDN